MSDQVLITIDGLDEVCRLFQEAPEEVMPSALLHGLQAGGAVIEAAIGARVPEKTGDMKADLGTSVTLDSNFRGGVAQVGFTAKEGAKAGWVEYGHHLVGHNPGHKDLGQVEPHPFMRPAAETAAGAAVEAMTDTMLDELSAKGLVDAA